VYSEAVVGKPLGSCKDFTGAAQTDMDVAGVAYGGVDLMKVTFEMVDKCGVGGLLVPFFT
jgi:hypothetical protein